MTRKQDNKVFKKFYTLLAIEYNRTYIWYLISERILVSTKMIECTKGEELWMMIYSKGLEETKFMNLGMYLGNCFFFTKNLDVFNTLWMCFSCEWIFNHFRNKRAHIDDGSCPRHRIKVRCSGETFWKIMSSSEKVFFGGNTQ